jgi:hypothetical protein
VNCAAGAAIMALAGKISAHGHYVAAVPRAFWPRQSSSNRRWLAYEIGQQAISCAISAPENDKTSEFPKDSPPVDSRQKDTEGKLSLTLLSLRFVKLTSSVKSPIR